MRKLGMHALCAKEIRKELKIKYPDTKFSVTSNSYSGGDSVRVKWLNGPTTKMIAEITKKYEYGKFNGMDDAYDYSNVRYDIPQTKYLFLDREYFEELINENFLNMKINFNGCEHLSNANDYDYEFSKKWNFNTPRCFITYHLRDVDLTEKMGELVK